MHIQVVNQGAGQSVPGQIQPGGRSPLLSSAQQQYQMQQQQQQQQQFQMHQQQQQQFQMQQQQQQQQMSAAHAHVPAPVALAQTSAPYMQRAGQPAVGASGIVQQGGIAVATNVAAAHAQIPHATAQSQNPTINVPMSMYVPQSQAQVQGQPQQGVQGAPRPMMQQVATGAAGQPAPGVPAQMAKSQAPVQQMHQQQRGGNPVQMSTAQQQAQAQAQRVPGVTSTTQAGKASLILHILLCE
jgi:hypothetical protein